MLEVKNNQQQNIRLLAVKALSDINPVSYTHLAKLQHMVTLVELM